jgi:hypothetical protein
MMLRDSALLSVTRLRLLITNNAIVTEGKGDGWRKEAIASIAKDEDRECISEQNERRGRCGENCPSRISCPAPAHSRLCEFVAEQAKRDASSEGLE